MRKPTLAAILALGSIPAFADPPPLTIEMVRQFAAAGMAPMVQDVEYLSTCPGLRMPADMAPAEIEQARLMHIPPGAYWLRENDAVIAQCLAGRH